MKPNYYEWMTNFMDSWKDLDGVKTTNWLSKNVKYFETPDGDPCSSWDEVLALWVVVPNNQKDISYSFQIVCSTEEVAVINWKMTRTLITTAGNVKQKIDGIFQVSLDDENKCNYFKQWRHTINL